METTIVNTPESSQASAAKPPSVIVQQGEAPDRHFMDFLAVTQQNFPTLPIRGPIPLAINSLTTATVTSSRARPRPSATITGPATVQRLPPQAPTVFRPPLPAGPPPAAAVGPSLAPIPFSPPPPPPPQVQAVLLQPLPPTSVTTNSTEMRPTPTPSLSGPILKPTKVAPPPPPMNQSTIQFGNLPAVTTSGEMPLVYGSPPNASSSTSIISSDDSALSSHSKRHLEATFFHGRGSPQAQTVHTNNLSTALLCGPV